MSSRSTKEAWLTGPADLKEAVVEDVPVKGSNVLVRSLPATYSNRAVAEAQRLTQTAKGDAQVTVDTERLEILQFAFGVVEPQFNVDEAKIIAERYAVAFKRVIAKIDELTGLSEKEVEDSQARFHGGEESEDGPAVGNGAAAGSARSDVPARAGARAGDAGS